MKATIITIGDEILIGQILDTNSRYISRALNAHGIVVAERTSIGDNRNQIVETLDRALAQSEVVIITTAALVVFVVQQNPTLCAN
jgi:nicotinamide-nucleotide amidase